MCFLFLIFWRIVISAKFLLFWFKKEISAKFVYLNQEKNFFSNSPMLIGKWLLNVLSKQEPTKICLDQAKNKLQPTSCRWFPNRAKSFKK